MIKDVGKVAIRLGKELVAHVRGTSVLGKLAKSSKPILIKQVAKQSGRFPFARNLFLRTFQRTIRSSRLFIRPLATLHYQHLAQWNDTRNRRWHWNTRFRGLWKLNRRNRNAGVVERVRDVFNTNIRYNNSLASEAYPERLDGYDIGNYIDQGCSAAIYELQRRNLNATNAFEELSSASKTTHKPFPLALKIMFNYDYNMSENRLWEYMGPEIVPLAAKVPKSMLKGRMGNIKLLSKHHPNVIKLHTAFIDVMPMLPGAENYPEVIPTAADYIPLNGEPKTLFIVMKRYNMTLYDYMRTCKRNYYTGRVMYGQLLEAIVFLNAHKISHRDMKSDNVLLEFDEEGEIPHLVLSDFGSALATGSWEVPYPDDSIDLGGNAALRAPEIRRAKAGPGVVLDFSMADTWSAATLGYEIFTRKNPFYRELSSATYAESDLPDLPRRLHYAVKEATRRMLLLRPEARVRPEIAANVVSISLFRFGHDVRSFLERCGIMMGWNTEDLKASFSKTLNFLGNHIETLLDNVTELYAAETIISKAISRRPLSPAELQLRATFLARLNREDVWPALEYFFDEEASRVDAAGGDYYSSASSGVSM
uniref:non-specific serine/threonine protein kinase n=1 Tax=Panagrellus redivivus TaxID=6233 RepID=A0A7E4ZVL3_PANRE